MTAPCRSLTTSLCTGPAPIRANDFSMAAGRRITLACRPWELAMPALSKAPTGSNSTKIRISGATASVSWDRKGVVVGKRAPDRGPAMAPSYTRKLVMG